MKPAISSQLRGAVCQTLQHFCGISFAPERLRLPAHPHAVRLYLPESVDPAELCRRLPLPAGELYAAPLIGERRAEGRLLLLDFTDGFYSALVCHVLHDNPPPESDLGRYCLNRLIRLGRKPASGCPADPIIQHTLLCCACLPEVGLAGVEQKIARMERHLSPGRERQAGMDAAAGVYAAMARLIYDYCSSERNEII